MPRTMKAAVVRAFSKPLSIEEVTVPKVTPGKILVKIEASGVCHTDLHAAEGDWPVKPNPPFIPGHEGVGIVAEVGEGVTSVKEGDRVGVPWLHSACGHCHHCITGWETLCVGHLPKPLEFGNAAPVLCAGVTVYKGLKETECKPGETVVISGIGGLGHMAVQYAKAMGMKVIAVDIADDKLKLARELGADWTLNASEIDVVSEVQKQMGGANGVLVTAVSRAAFKQGVGMLGRGGTMSLVGLPPGTFELDIFDTVLSRKTIRGSIVGTRADLQEALEFAGDGKVHSHFTTEPMENINSIFDRMRDGKIDGRIVMSI